MFLILYLIPGMKKWITSNYDYMVPEFDDDGSTSTSTLQPNFDSFLDSIKRGIDEIGLKAATPVVVGPVTMVYLTKFNSFSSGFEIEQRRQLLLQLIPIYKSLLLDVANLGVSEIQIHEAALVFEDSQLLPLFKEAYPSILPPKKDNNGQSINMVASFMEDIGKDHYQWLISVDEISIISLDFTRGDNLSFMETYGFPKEKTLGAGLIDSRNVWRVNPKVIEPIIGHLIKLTNNIRVQPSGSLQYNPWSLVDEKSILVHPAGQVLSFAAEKLQEVVLVAKSIKNGHSVLKPVSKLWKTYQASIEIGRAHV